MSEGIAKTMCLDKKYYSSMIKAFCAIGRMKVLYPKTPDQRAYPCPICHGWHLTTKPKNVFQNH